MADTITIGDVTVRALLNLDGFSEGIKNAMRMLTVLSKTGKELGVFDSIDLSKPISEVDRLTKANEDYQKSLKQLPPEIKKTADETKNLTDKQEKAINANVTLASKLNDVGLRLQGIRAIYDVLNSSVSDLIQTAARVVTMNIVVEQVGKVAGYSAHEIRGYVNAVKEKGITSAESASTVAKLIQADLDLAEASRIARVAQDAAVIGNINSSEALDRLIYGITSLNPLVLRAIGLAVSFSDSFQKYAAQHGKQAKDLSETEKRQAALNEVLIQGDKIVGTYEASLESAGKKAGSYARYLEELKVSLGNLLLPVFGKAIDFLTTITKLLTDAPDNIRASALAVFTLATAWVFFNSKMPPAILAFGAFFALANTLPPQIRILMGVLSALAGVIVLLTVKLSALTGGLWIVVAAIGTAAGLISSGMSELNRSFSTEQLEKFNDEIKKTEQNIKDLETVRQRHIEDTALSTDQQERYNEALGNSVKLYPEIVSGIDSQTNSLKVNTKQTEDAIRKEKELLNIRKDALVVIQQTQMEDLISQIGESHQEIERMTGILLNNGEEINNQMRDTELAALSLGSRLRGVQHNLRDVSKNIVELHDNNADLKKSLDEYIQSAVRMGTISRVLADLRSATRDNVHETNALTQAVNTFVDSAIAGYTAAAKVAEQYLSIQKIVQTARDLIKLGDETGGAIGDALSIKGADWLNQVSSAIEKMKATTPGTTTPKTKSSTSSRESKEESENLDQVQKLLEEIQKTEAELASARANNHIGYAKDLEEEIQKLKERLTYLQTGERMLSDVLKELKPDKWLDDTKKHMENRIKETTEAQKQASLDIFAKQIELIANEYDRRRAEINNAYDLEIERIAELKDIADTQRTELRDLARLKQQQDMKDLIHQAVYTGFEKIHSIAANVKDLLKLGADHVLSRFFQVLDIVKQIVEILQSASLLKDIIGFISSIIPGAGAVAGAAGAIAGSPGSMSGIPSSVMTVAMHPDMIPKHHKIEISVTGKLKGYGRDLHAVIEKINNEINANTLK